MDRSLTNLIYKEQRRKAVHHMHSKGLSCNSTKLVGSSSGSPCFRIHRASASIGGREDVGHPIFLLILRHPHLPRSVSFRSWYLPFLCVSSERRGPINYPGSIPWIGLLFHPHGSVRRGPYVPSGIRPRQDKNNEGTYPTLVVVTFAWDRIRTFPWPNLR